MLKGLLKKDRSAKAKMNILSMLFLKGLSILINLAFVPLLIDILNTEKYGIWLTITTITGWVSFFDIGLGHGLRNKLVEAISNDDSKMAKEYVSTSYLALFGIVAILLALQIIFTPMLNWSQILNAPMEMNSELTTLVFWVLFLFCLQFLFKLITSVMLALQMPAFCSLAILLGQLLSFLIIYYAKTSSFELTLLNLGLVISILPILVFVASSIFIFSGKYKIYRPSIGSFNKSLIRPILALSSKFFAIQITALFLFQSDNIIIAHTAGPAAVTEFNIAFKYVGIINMIFTIIMVPYWSATTEAYVKKDYNWIRKTIGNLNKFWILMFVVGAVLICFSKPLYHLWMGDKLEVNYLLLILILCYNIFYMRWTMYGNILNGIGKIKLQFMVTLMEVLIHIPLAYILGIYWGLYGVIISMIGISILNTIWPPIQLRKLLDETAEGIWNK